MTLPDLIKDFFDSTKERLKTPISGAFLWSFTIFNWRPIFLLLFSSASIEDKIIVINYEYCNFWAIFWPVVFATFYILLVPKIMLMIEKDLSHTVDERVTKRYEAEKHIVMQKRTVAKEEYLLKGEENGNKTIEDYNNQIRILEEKVKSYQESLKQTDESYKLTVNTLTDQLKNASSVIEDLQMWQKRTNSQSKYGKVKNSLELNAEAFGEKTSKEVERLFASLSFSEFTFLEAAFVENGEIDYKELDGKYDDFLVQLRDKGVLILTPVPNGLKVHLTDIGMILYDHIQRP